MLDPKKAGGEAPPYRGRQHTGRQVWYGYLSPSDARIERLEILDHDNDGSRDIALRTTRGSVFLNFEGKTIEAKNAQFALVNNPR
jgi:hypothetical protein